MGKQNLKKTRPKKGDARTEYGEQKANITLSVTPTARDNYDAAATILGISRSELIERLGRKGVEWLVEQGQSEHKSE